MAHELEMVNGKVCFAYAGEVPWHGLGVKVPADLTPEQMLEKAGLDWEVEKIPAFAEVAGEKIDVGKSALVRTSDNRVLDVVGNDWNPLQNAEAFEFFNDFVMAGEMENAFCAVRPPGHHACRNKAMGFCFVNSVAVAAKYALQRHGLQRVAIVDFDVHHGNGTEDIVAGDGRILMVSFYQHPFYPPGGARSDASNLVNLPVPAYTKGDAVRALIEAHWLPRLEAFAPQMIFISAGFDAHRDDDMGHMGLLENDYAWITRRIKDVAQRHAQGRIVSCLEGGYNLLALARSVEAHVRVLADME